ncbi:DUF3813 domain-containing protein [Bacillus pseudomycoides]|jgi:hypothetical protein|uniref:DUF3813 domain-containing protein n=1 Tax=Bacillus pseudomycoides TaxID=64104 RepID=A0A2A8GRN3_9BACI|nr:MULTISPECIES: DUF3813 domain-containing protein [Bacillus]AIK38463.1 hypothetical protein DJ92_3782 [Bacillus pseudomycoides]AJI17244.1 hypothetical protein BG07_1163 [Bacillus pseudomycoides]EEM06462.1 hypothetical protein bmyco0002_9750 [Bacillus pseudomycoides]EEM12286.1 hypothetical protein bmyco0003_9320 [Bacillus pseudomycoides]EEM18082.1 hypothetical protein bpmyx0001_10120 [Bacillus pseudomycoides DSM 12442]
MGNLLFQQARDAVAGAVSCSSGTEQRELVYRAKNALQSAYANSSTAEKVQLREMQQQLQNITNTH